MAKKKTKAPPPNTTEVANPAPTVSPDVQTGLENIKLYGDRDAELFIATDESFFEEAFMTTSILTAEEGNRFIKKVEALVRSSPEYKAYISYLRNDLRMDHCSFLPNLNMSEGEINLEMHHCPLTLFNIVDIIVNHRLARNQAITSMTIADEVMQMHFENKIGILPVSTSIHKLIHSGALLVHPAMVHGDWMGLLRDYPDGVNEELMGKLISFVGVTEEQLQEHSVKVNAAETTPILREDAFVPTLAQLEVALLAPATTE